MNTLPEISTDPELIAAVTFDAREEITAAAVSVAVENHGVAVIRNAIPQNVIRHCIETLGLDDGYFAGDQNGIPVTPRFGVSSKDLRMQHYDDRTIELLVDSISDTVVPAVTCNKLSRDALWFSLRSSYFRESLPPTADQGLAGYLSCLNDGWGTQVGGLVMAWAPLTACGEDAPALEVVLDPNNGNWYPPSLSDLVNPLLVEDTPFREVVEHFGADKVLRLAYQPGDLVIFGQFTFYRTFYSESMTRPMMAIEIKFHGDRQADERGVYIQADGNYQLHLHPEQMKIENANIAVLLPDRPAVLSELEQRLEGVRTRYGDLARIGFFSEGEFLDHYAGLLDSLSIAALSDGCLTEFNIIVDMVDTGERALNWGASKAARTYRVYDEGRIMPDIPGIDSYEYPFIDTHAFNRHSPKSTADKLEFNCFYYFPYGYLHRVTGLGPINEFGHRIEIDFRELADRGPEHKVVACFGGSAGFSVSCLHEQMYTKVMERRLNELCGDGGADLKFTVLNFGSPGNVVLNEIMHYILFCHRIRPDIVVTHDGANDLGYATGADGYLVESMDIVYQGQLVEWAEILHNPNYKRTGEAMISPGEKAANIASLRSYVARKRQFSDLVRGQGGLHVWGLQPIFLSKKELSPIEHDRIWTNPRVEAKVRDHFDQYHDLYKTFLENKPDFGDDLFVDLHTLFGTMGADRTLLADVVHMLPEGDRVIGEHYAEQIFASLVPQLQEAGS